jgi:protein-L-isoaspartate(D-aspartate) O-methyltransferase
MPLARASMLPVLLLLVPPAVAAQQLDFYSQMRERMVEQQIRDRGVNSPQLLAAMGTVPRHLFVSEDSRSQAYADEVVPIGCGETILQPYLSARMIELLQLDGDERVLEIGTGSGYDAAVLSRVAKRVYTVEINADLAAAAEQRFEKLGYENIQVRVGDGYQGWPEEAPFDAILLTAASPRVAEPLLEQLRNGGRMVVAVGGFVQDLLVLTKTEDGIDRQRIAPVRLKAMSGEIQKERH